MSRLTIEKSKTEKSYIRTHVFLSKSRVRRSFNDFSVTELLGSTTQKSGLFSAWKLFFIFCLDTDTNRRYCHHHTKSRSIHNSNWCSLFKYIGPNVSSYNRNDNLLGTTRHGSFQLAPNKKRTVGRLRRYWFADWHICQYRRDNRNLLQLVKFNWNCVFQLIYTYICREKLCI